MIRTNTYSFYLKKKKKDLPPQISINSTKQTHIESWFRPRLKAYEGAKEETKEKEGERERQMRRETETEKEERKRRVRIIERAERSFLSSPSPSDTDIISSLPDCLLTHIL